MRLLDTDTLELCEFQPGSIPEYAILSHTWGDQEVLYDDARHGRDHLLACGKTEGLDKLLKSTAEAAKNGYQYLWNDTCCIDKSSSAELSEAINSMFAWYRDSEVCYAYLADFDSTEGEPIESRPIRWFTRGWTLQELIAPMKVYFYDKNWVRFGDKSSLAAQLVAVTGINELVFRWHFDPVYYIDCDGYHTYPNEDHSPGHSPESRCTFCRRDLNHVIQSFRTATRMSWAASRETTRPEDIAYSLLGIFGVNMPMLYGEGERAFLRLQQAILQTSTDQSILAFNTFPLGNEYDAASAHGILAKHPKQFLHYQQDRERYPCVYRYAGGKMVLSNAGLELTVYTVPAKLVSQPSSSKPAKVIWLAVLKSPVHDGEAGALAIPIAPQNNTSDIRQFFRSMTRDYLWEVSPGSETARSFSDRSVAKIDPTHLKEETILLQKLETESPILRITSQHVHVTLGNHASGSLHLVGHNHQLHSWPHTFGLPEPAWCNYAKFSHISFHQNGFVFGVSAYKSKSCEAGFIIGWGRRGATQQGEPTDPHRPMVTSMRSDPALFVAIYPWTPDADSSALGDCILDDRSVNNLIKRCRFDVVHETNAGELRNPDLSLWTREISLGEKRIVVSAELNLVNFLGNTTVVINLETRDVRPRPDPI